VHKIVPDDIALSELDKAIPSIRDDSSASTGLSAPDGAGLSGDVAPVMEALE